MKANLKTLALAVVASLTFVACAAEPAGEPKAETPAAPTETPEETVIEIDNSESNESVTGE